MRAPSGVPIGANQADHSVARGAAWAQGDPAQVPCPAAASTARADGWGTANGPAARRLLQGLWEEWACLDERIKAHDDGLAVTNPRENQQARRLSTLPGIGVIN